MPLTTLVKISSINNLSDARYCAGMGVELIGFDINPNSANYVDPAKYHEICGWISAVKLVGEITEIGDISDDYEFDFIEISNPDLIQDVPIEYPVILSMSIEHLTLDEVTELLDQYSYRVAYFILKMGESIITQLDELATLCDTYPIILGSINKDFIANQFDLVNPAGIEIKGGEEEIVGFKDYDEIGGILELIEID